MGAQRTSSGRASRSPAKYDIESFEKRKGGQVTSKPSALPGAHLYTSALVPTSVLSIDAEVIVGPGPCVRQGVSPMQRDARAAAPVHAVTEWFFSGTFPELQSKQET